MKQAAITILFTLTTVCSSIAQDRLPFNTINWTLTNGEFIDFDNIMCLAGEALLNDLVFKNGVIEFDIWLADERSYPGIYFRDMDNGSYEYIYFRPHRFGLYDDALQYAPAFNDEVCWQLYFGEGSTSSFNGPYREWVHVKLVVLDDKAQLFIGDMNTPALVVDQLAANNRKGKIKLTSGHQDTYISNFKITTSSSLPTAKSVTLPETSNHIISDFQLSKTLPHTEFEDDAYPRFYSIFSAEWEDVPTDDKGLLNISKYRKNQGNENTVYAKSTISSDKDKILKLAFGYSDKAKVYLNKKLIYSGNYAYQSRGNSFTGTIGLKDTLYLELKKGLNELFIKSSETFGGWGVKFASNQAISIQKNTDKALTQEWHTRISDLSPESILYDEVNDVIYVTHFDNQFNTHQERKGFISKLSATGNMLDSLWITDLKAPTGLCRFGDKMYVVDREELIEISIRKSAITTRYPYSENIAFANDVITDDKGTVYITNSDESDDVTDILTLKDGDISSWMNSNQLVNLNGIFYKDGQLILGNGEDSLLLEVDIVSQKVRTITSFGTGIVDGIRVDHEGNYLVSIWEGGLYKVDQKGKAEQLIDGTGKFNLADFEYSRESKMIFIPTFLDHSVRTFRYD